MNYIALVSVHSGDETTQEYYRTILYAILAQREPYQNISHRGTLPAYSDHCAFVKSKPYKDWFIIQDKTTKKTIGSIYLSKENEIGIFICKNYKKQGYGRQALNALMEYFKHVRELKANIAPLNSPSISFFVNMGFRYSSMLEEQISDIETKIIQYTYKMANPYYVEHVQGEVEA